VRNVYKDNRVIMHMLHPAYEHGSETGCMILLVCMNSCM
jgi:hypothetical protein